MKNEMPIGRETNAEGKAATRRRSPGAFIPGRGLILSLNLSLNLFLNLSLNLSLILIPALAAACSSSSGGADADGDSVNIPLDAADAVVATDAGADVPPDAAAEDAPTPPPPPCPHGAAPEGILDLFPGLPDTQIHPAVAADDDGAWIAFDVPRDDGSGHFETWAARLRCDGQVAIAPFRVESSARGNAIDPDIAVGGGRVLVAWQVDTGASPNLFVATRLFDGTGTPLGDDTLVGLSQDGTKVDANAWMARVAHVADGRFLLAGAWAAPDATGFQAFVVPVDGPQGATTDLVEVHPDPDASQVYPVLAVQGDGKAAVAWTRQLVSDTDHVGMGVIDPAAPSAVADPRTIGGYDPSSAPSLAAVPGDPTLSLLAFQAGNDDTDIDVRTVRLPAAPGSPLRLGKKGVADHSATVAVGPAGAAVTWMRVRSGIKNDIRFQALSLAGTSPAASGDEVAINPAEAQDEHAAAPYGVAMAGVQDAFVLVWAEGKSPAFRLKARFVKTQ